MKRLLYILVCSILLVGCKPIDKFSYFYTETVETQATLDSLLVDQSTNYLTWENYTVQGMHRDKIVGVTTYIYWINQSDTAISNISVIKFSDSDTAVIKLIKHTRK